MLKFKIKHDEKNNAYLETDIDGKALLTIAQLNKGTAFTESEREAFGLIGKLPAQVETLDEQVARAYLQYKSYDEQINRNIHLNHLLNNNQVVFYRLVQLHLEEMLPTIYTPIVGAAVKTFNKKFTQPRGLYISYNDRHRIEEILDNRTNPEVQLIVVSDGEGVLGIGDQGIGGMAIPVAKLMVYTAFAGINPMNTLPIMLDAGTNNEELLNDPLYLGWRHPRISGAEYSEFIDQFIQAVQKKFSPVFLHWEDFGRSNAYRNLLEYRDKICSFNDDIQGTGVVAMSALLSAVGHTGSNLKEQRIVVFGAGTAGMGITEAIEQGLQRAGLSESDAKKHFWLLDRPGLLTEHTGALTPTQAPYIRSEADIAEWSVEDPNHISLLEVIQNVKPTVLIGCSAMTGAFTQEIIETMAEHVDQPIIFPLSNPTEKSEAKPQDIIEWTKGRALIATGSPFDDVPYAGKNIPISQCNNYLAFPGIGLGVMSSRAEHLTDDMLWAASEALAEYEDKDSVRILPSISEAQNASKRIALAVGKAAEKAGLADLKPGESIETNIETLFWEPNYLPYRCIK